MPMNIATALNRKYIPYTAVMLHSLCKNNPVAIHAYLLHSELIDKDIQLLEDSLRNFDIKIIPLKVDSALFSSRLPRNTQWSIETYYRLLLLDLLPDTVDRLLYLDVDIIINQSLDELYTVDFVEDEIIACIDSCGKKTWDKFGPKQKEMFAPMVELGYQYFNAGVMLMNIEKIRQKHNFNTYLKAIEEWNYQMDAPDQDILNYVHWQHIGYIDCWQYDLFARIAYGEGMTYDQVKKETTIIHYAGTKPWDADNCHFTIEKLWWDYAKLTPFYLQLLEDFLGKTMTDTTVENYINSILTNNQQLQEQLNKSLELNQKLFAMVQKS